MKEWISASEAYAHILKQVLVPTRAQNEIMTRVLAGTLATMAKKLTTEKLLTGDKEVKQNEVLDQRSFWTPVTEHRGCDYREIFSKGTASSWELDYLGKTPTKRSIAEGILFNAGQVYQYWTTQKAKPPANRPKGSEMQGPLVLRPPRTPLS
jgi:hypothetical protein